MAPTCEEPICGVPNWREFGIWSMPTFAARSPTGFDAAAAGVRFGADYN